MVHVLIVEDDDIMRDMLVQMLSNEHLEVKSVCNGKEALEILQEYSFDLVITDLVMPEVEGIEFIIQLKKNKKILPVIAISGGGRGSASSYLNIAEKLGATYTFDKPLDKVPFLTAVHNCISA